jgi:hypothetical protein
MTVEYEREQPPGSGDRDLWRRCLLTDASEDETTLFLDLAGYADGLLDRDDRERIGALLAVNPTAAADVAAAMVLAVPVEQDAVASERIIRRACALRFGESKILPFVRTRRVHYVMDRCARWASLAAAVMLVSWLGFAMGTDATRALGAKGVITEEGFLPELFDPANGFLRDLEGAQT